MSAQASGMKGGRRSDGICIDDFVLRDASSIFKQNVLKGESKIKLNLTT